MNYNHNVASFFFFNFLPIIGLKRKNTHTNVKINIKSDGTRLGHASEGAVEIKLIFLKEEKKNNVT